LGVDRDRETGDAAGVLSAVLILLAPAVGRVAAIVRPAAGGARKIRGVIAFLIGVMVLPLGFWWSQRSVPTFDLAEEVEPTWRRRSTGEPVGPHSTIRRGDYVGPRVCGECHEDKHADWKLHPHSRMNMDATGITVSGIIRQVGADTLILHAVNHFQDEHQPEASDFLVFLQVRI